MKHLLSILLISSICLTQEMEVDGNLKVTGAVESATIDSLQQQINSLLLLIADLEFRIANMECLNTGIIPDGYCDCYGNALDLCGVCAGDDMTCTDCAGVPNGDSLEDMCGTCDNDSSNNCVQDCFGEWGGTSEEDICGVCGGDAIEGDVCNFALRFGGDYVQLGSDEIFDLQNGTVSAWIKFNSFPLSNDYSAIISKESSGNGNGDGVIGYGDGNEPDRFHMRISGGDTVSHYVYSTTEPIINQWYYITGTFGNEGMKLYVNAIQEDNTGFSGGWTKSVNNLLIGSLLGWDRFFNGDIDEFSLWNYAQSESDIQSYMLTPPTGSEEGLIGYWKFNTGIGDTLYDHSGNQNHGTIYGATWVERE